MKGKLTPWRVMRLSLSNVLRWHAWAMSSRSGWIAHLLSDVIVVLTTMFQTQAKTESYEITKVFWSCHMAEGSSANEHVIKLIDCGIRLQTLGFSNPGWAKYRFDVVFTSPFNNGCIMIQNMSGRKKTLKWLLAKLKSAKLMWWGITIKFDCAQLACFKKKAEDKLKRFNSGESWIPLPRKEKILEVEL